MEKNKNRTDLLAAGRKKLQQFRQKKETKGKSSHKSSKSEHEGDVDVAPHSKAVEAEPTSSLNAADVGSIDSSVLHSMEKSVALNVDFSNTDPSVSHETVSTHDVELAPVDLEEKEPLAADTDRCVDSAELPHSLVTRDEERESSPSQEYSADVFSTQERENQEADCLGSNQSDGNGEESCTKVELEGFHVSKNRESGKNLAGASQGLVDIEEATHRAEETNEVDGASGFNDENHEAGRPHEVGCVFVSAESTHKAEGTPDSNPYEFTEEATHRAEGINEMDGALVFAEENHKAGRPHEMGGVFVPTEATHEAEGTLDSILFRPTEEATNRMDPSNEVDDISVSAEENHNVEGTCDVDSVYVSTEAAHKAEGAADMNLEEGTENATRNVEGINEAINRTEGSNVVESVPFYAEANQRIEGTHEMGFVSFSAEATHKAEGIPYVNSEEKSDPQMENVEADSSREDNREIILSALESDTERKQEILSGGRTISLGADKGSVDIYQLAEVLSGLDETEVRFLLESIPSASKAESGNMGDFIMLENGFADVLESLKRQLYFTNVSKDLLHLQLTDQIELQMGFDQRTHQLQNEVSMLRFLLKETEEYNTSLDKEIEERSSQFLSAREEIEESTVRASELQTKLEMSHGELTILSVELADYKGLLETLETENANLNENLILVSEERKKLEEEKDNFVQENEKFSTQLANLNENLILVSEERNKLELEKDYFVQENEKFSAQLAILNENLIVFAEERKKLEEEKDYLVGENEKISARLLEHQEHLAMEHGKHVQLEFDLKEAIVSLEQLTEENMSLSSCLDVHKAKLKEIENEHRQLLSQPEDIGNRLEGWDMPHMVHNYPTDDDSVRFVGLKTHLEEAEKIMQKLEKEIEGIHAHSVLLSRSGGKGASSGVSKLIQAFESKVQHDGNDSEEGQPLVEGEQTASDPFQLAKEQLGILRALLKELDKVSELEILYESSKKQNSNLEAENVELVRKLSEYQSRMDDLDSQFLEIQQRSNEMVGLFLNQVENLQKEVGDKTLILEQEWSSAIAAMSVSVEKLDASMGRLHTYDALSIHCHITASINAASEVIKELCGKLEASDTSHKAILSSYKSLGEKFSELHVSNEMAVGLLGMIYGDLRQFVSDSCEDVNGDRQVDLLQPNNYVYLIKKLGELLGERLLFRSAKNELESELINRTQEIKELKERCIDSKSMLTLVEDVKTILNMEDIEVDPNMESLVAFLVQKYREAIEKLTLSREEFYSKVMELSELQAKMHQLSSSNLRQEDEISILKESLRKMEVAVETVHSALQAKGVELEQSEQRVSSIREKLSIAVAKGKGLVVQRDSLKHSLSEMSAELERCSQELHLKDSRLREVETKLKAYSEAGERIEALESELSYIRNSATALRESFLLKDSVLQRIEEILEDLELPEHFHSRDIIEKIEWLARSVVGNSLPMNDWDQRSSVGGGSYSDGWKDDVQPSSNPGLDDSRRKYEELQSKFYGLAEQNEMLEQSLMERNSLVQRWEEVLDRIDMPSQLRSMEPEDRIKWLGNALSEAHHDIDSLHHKIENFETYCGAMTVDLEESQKKVSNLEATLVALTRERELLSESLENLTREHENISEKATQYELEKDKLWNEVCSLQEKLVEKVENKECHPQIEGEMKRFQVMVCDALQGQSTEDEVCDGSSTERLEGLLRKLIEKYRALSFEKPVLNYTEEADAVLDERRKQDSLKEELERALNNLVDVEGERDKILEKHQSLVVEFEALGKQRDDLQEQLNQEEQKLVSSREKLNVAVRKGKGLVQQRDSLKQTIEDMNTEVERLKSELNKKENILVQYEQDMRDLSTYPERVEALEHESSFLRNRLEETEHRLLDLQTAITSSEHELKKSKRANELLIAELNEVQERGDGLQEELENVETAKIEAFSRLEEFINARSEERKNELSEILKLKAGVDQVWKGCSGFTNVLVSVFTANLEILRNVEAWMESLLKQMDGTNVIDLPLGNAHVGMLPSNSVNEVKFPTSGTLSETVMQDHLDGSSIIEVFGIVGHGLQECMKEINALRENLYQHSISSDQQAKTLSKVMQDVHKEISTQKESLESMKKDITHLELTRKEKETETLVLHRNIALLYKACTGSILEIENRKAQMVGNGLAPGVHLLGKVGMDLKLPTGIDGQEVIDGQGSITEECIRNVADSLLLAVKDSDSIQSEIIEGSQKELKATILNLQTEHQEKDIQRNRICAELVSQIKEAEVTAKNYLVDLKTAKTHVDNLEKRIEAVEEERNKLELRIKELQDGEASSIIELQKRIISLTDLLTAKEQEIEALMQALDEEESQMEGLTNQIKELEKVLQQKNLALENLEASRGKAMAKLSTTVSKFDELHQLSGSLLSEIENLQSQLQGRDEEISFLRQEVTRCTNDVLAASQESNQRSSTGMHDLLTWLDTLISRFGVHDVHFDDMESNRMQTYKEILEKQITSFMSELEDLRVMSQSRDALLQVERTRIEELRHKEETLENSLREKEFQLASFQAARDLGETTSLASSEIVELEPMINKRAVAGASITPHVRSVRKVNNDQVAIGIDMDPDGSTVDDEDDDKVHGFRSLTKSRIVPKFTRPVSDMIDGLWVSCDRALMRQPALRLGIILYWVVVHALLATSIV